MKDAELRVPITCPECAKESLSEFPLAAIAEALATGDTIRLFASCHDKAWNASYVEREQLRQYLDASAMTAPGGVGRLPISFPTASAAKDH